MPSRLLARARQHWKLLAGVTACVVVALVVMAVVATTQAGRRSGPAPATSSRLTPGAEQREVVLSMALRQFWPEGRGYCGEHSVQSAASGYGIWVSQRAAYELAGGEVLLNVNLESPLLDEMLGLNFTRFTRFRQRVTEESLAQFMVFIKRSIVAEGAPIIYAQRAKEPVYGDRRVQADFYDHIVPAYGFVYTPATVNRYDPTDAMVWTTGYKNEISRALGSVGSSPFYAAGPPNGPDTTDCAFRIPEGGCISNDEGSFAVSLKGVKSNSGLFLPLRLEITSWADGTPAADEPHYSAPSQGAYLLDLTRAGLAPGSDVTVYRLDMQRGRRGSGFSSGNQLQELADLAALEALCGDVTGCARASFTVGRVPLADAASPVLGPEATAALGPIPSDGVVFFLAVRGRPSAGELLRGNATAGGAAAP